MMSSFSLPEQLCAILAFLAIFLLTMLLFVFVGMILSRYVKLMYIGGLNRVVGGLFGTYDLGQGNNRFVQEGTSAAVVSMGGASLLSGGAPVTRVAQAVWL